MREALLVHAAARLVLHPHIKNIQVEEGFFLIRGFAVSSFGTRFSVLFTCFKSKKLTGF